MSVIEKVPLHSAKRGSQEEAGCYRVPGKGVVEMREGWGLASPG